MRKFARAVCVGVAAMGAAGLLGGCKTGGGGDRAPIADVTGFWEGTTAKGKDVALNLYQNGAHVTGSARCIGIGGNLTGSVSGNTFTYTVVWQDSTVLGAGMNGTAVVAGPTMTGASNPAAMNFTASYQHEPDPNG